MNTSNLTKFKDSNEETREGGRYDNTADSQQT